MPGAPTTGRRTGDALPGRATTRAALDEYRERIPLRLEDRLLDVAQVLAVDLQRQRPVAPDRDPVDVGARVDERVLAEAAARRARQQPGQSRRPDRRRRDVAEAALEPRAVDEPQRQRPREGVRRAVGNEQERGAADALDLERGVESKARLHEQPERGSREGEIAGALSRVGAPARVDPAHYLGVESDAGREREAPAVGAAEADPPRAPSGERRRDGASGVDGVAREPEGARQDARPAPRQEAHRRARVETV